MVTSLLVCSEDNYWAIWLEDYAGSVRVYVDPSFVEVAPCGATVVHFPRDDARLIRTADGNLALVRAAGSVAHYIEAQAGADPDADISFDTFQSVGGYVQGQWRRFGHKFAWVLFSAAKADAPATISVTRDGDNVLRGERHLVWHIWPDGTIVGDLAAL